MLSPELTPLQGIVSRGTLKLPNVERNYFVIKKADWTEKPRIDVKLTKDDSPIKVTRVVVNSGDESVASFRIKYKEDIAQEAWLSYSEAPEDTIKVNCHLYEG